ncbi:MAG: hypothetical protein SF069_15235 [Phycisphaerae bacterium]|nr:hypothetical protein [Phycisphaerae bacterium]
MAMIIASMWPAYQIWRPIDWYKQAPVWILHYRIDQDDIRASNELGSRIRDRPGLTRKDWQRTISRALRGQRDARGPQSPFSSWLHILEQLDSAALLSDEEWSEMVQNSARNVAVTVRSRCRDNDSIPFRVDALLTATFGSGIEWTPRFTYLGGDGSAVEVGRPNPPHAYIQNCVADYPPLCMLDQPRLSPGKYRLRVDLRGRYRKHGGMCMLDETEILARSLPPSLRDRARLLLAQEKTGPWRHPDQSEAWALYRDLPAPHIARVIEVDLEIVPKDSDADLEHIRGEEVRRLLQESIVVQFTDLPRDPPLSKFLRRRPQFHVTRELPWPLVFSVEVVVDDQIIKIGALRVPENSSPRTYDTRSNAVGGIADKACLILRPDPLLARQSLTNQFVDESIDFGTFDFWTGKPVR